MSSADRYAWTGREYDAETGLYFHRARTYSPEQRRFIQEDPLAGSTSPYAYSRGTAFQFTTPPIIHCPEVTSQGLMRGREFTSSRRMVRSGVVDGICHFEASWPFVESMHDAGYDMRFWPGGPDSGEWWPDHYFTMMLVAAVLYLGFHLGWMAGAFAGAAVVALRYAVYWLYRYRRSRLRRRS